MASWLKRLFGAPDPLSRPCRCGGDAQVRLAPERECEPSAGAAYCYLCLGRAVHSGLVVATGEWIVFQPFRDAACFVPYALPELYEFPETTQWPTHAQRLLASTKSPCAQCGEHAPWLWVPTRSSQRLLAFQEDPGWSRYTDTSSPPTGLLRLCADHLADALMDSLHDRDVRLQEFVLPAAGPGVWLPWGY